MKNRPHFWHRSFGLVLISVGVISSSGCLLPAVILGATATTVGVNTAGSNLSAGTQLDDSTLRLKVIDTLNQFPELSNDSNVEVTTFDHIVLLLGQVPSDAIKQKVTTAVAGVTGVSLVYNQLVVGPRVSYGQYAHDAWISSLVKANMVGKVNPLHFKVVTENAVVYLLGVTTQEEGAKAAEVASQTRGVQQVVTAYSYIQPSDSASSTNATPMPSSPNNANPNSAPTPKSDGSDDPF